MIYRTAHGGTAVSNAYIGSVPCGGTLTDIGLLGDTTMTPPTNNTTGSVNAPFVTANSFIASGDGTTAGGDSWVQGAAASVNIPNTCLNLMGNAGRNHLVGPGLLNLDFGVGVLVDLRVEHRHQVLPRLDERIGHGFSSAFVCRCLP